MRRVPRTYRRWVFALLLVGLGVAVWRPWSRSPPDRDRQQPAAARSLRLRWPTAAAAAAGTLTGRVLDPEGRPVAGARVVPVGHRSSLFGPGLAHATTDVQGLFRIEDLAPGRYFVVATAEGWVAARSELADVASRAIRRVEVRLAERGLPLEGRITDLGGGPIVGAAVFVDSLRRAVSDGRGHYALTLPPGAHRALVTFAGYVAVDLEVFMAGPTTRDVRMVPGARITGRVVAGPTGEPAANVEVALSWSAERRTERTDSGGRFDFPELGPGRYRLEARQASLVATTAPITLAVAETRSDLLLALDRGLVLAGRVLDPAGRGVADAHLEARPAVTPEAPPARARSDGEGRYRLEGLLPGLHEVSAGGAGRQPARASVRLTAGDVRDLDLVLRPAVAVRGRVLTPAGDPVDGARVVASLGGPGGLAAREGTHSTEDGTYQLETLGPGVLTIVAGHALGQARFGPAALADGEGKVIDLVLRAGGAIAGQARREDGAPAAAVRVSAKRQDDPRRAPWEAVTGPDGRYRLAGLPAGRVLVTAAQPWDRDVASDELTHRFVDLGDGEEKSGVDLLIPEVGLRIEGVALAPDGRRLLAALITAADEDAAGEGGRRSGIHAYSDADGRFALEGLHGGHYAVRAEHPDYPDVRLAGVAAGASDLVVRFAAEPRQ
jgi:protocatechuate 3,4-dioxygenase beta subunit/5-hydroxyisourate hydrolase-like protein (transthyretin family)